MKNVIFFIIALSLFSCGSTIDPCKKKIKQPSTSESFKVYRFDGLGYVVGMYERQARPDSNGVFQYYEGIGYKDFDTVFVRLVFDPRYQVYYPFPDNQAAGYNTIWEDDSCKAKQHWVNYTKQWTK